MDDYCAKAGINLDTILTDSPNKVKELSNGCVIDIYTHCLSLNIPIKDIAQILGKITTSNVAVNACVAKIYRVLKLDKSKRGPAREEFHRQTFTLPTETATSESTDTQKPHTQEHLQEKSIEEVLEEKLKERRSKVEAFRQENKLLKRKLIRKEKALKDRTEAKEVSRTEERESTVSKIRKTVSSIVRKTSTEVLRHTVQIRKLKKKLQSKQLQMTESRKEAGRLKKDEQQLVAEREHLNEVINTLEQDLKEQKSENEELMKERDELDENVRYLENIIDDQQAINPGKNVYSSKLVNCAINLTNMSVATKQVGPVIKEVAKLCGKKLKNVPSRQAVVTFVDRKIALAHKHVAEVAASSRSTTLYTDETRKHGRTYETYIISDEHQNSYMLGLREMANKSGASTCETFQQILNDIANHCNENQDLQVGYELLTNIKNTMSDRASTEKTFNGLLSAYRQECLPHVIDNYDELSGEQKQLCGQMNNFFCGLHLLVAMADVSESTISKFEQNFEKDDIGSAADPHLKRYHKSESGALRLLRSCSKVCAMGEDEKSGASHQWKTYLGQKQVKNRILRFRHNRFNMMFMVGGSVFYHAEDLLEFLDNVHGKSNDLLKAVALDVKENLFLAGAKALGLVSKFITSPLWRLIEEPGHILDMNIHFKALVDFLDAAHSDQRKTELFMTGENTPFEVEINDDAVMKKLIEPHNVDEIVLPLLQNIFLAIKQLFFRMIPEHLPGGRFWEPSETLREQTRSAKKHNKMPEFVFGQLDHMIAFRPNATMLANEAFVMYSFNKTEKWLEHLPEDERNEVIEKSRKEGRKISETFKERIKTIQEKQLEQQREKQRELERIEAARVRKAEQLTLDVCYYGLWQSKLQVEEGIKELGDNKKEVEQAIKSQHQFRKNVLKQTYKDKTVYNLSKKDEHGKYKKFDIETLKKNLLLLIESVSDIDTTEVKHGKIPLFVGKRIEHQFSDGNMYKGHVISIVPGFPEWYNIKYDDDTAVYAYNLKEDYKKGEVKLLV